MTRRPTSQKAAYAWHRDMLAGKAPATTHEPQCGWFVRKLVKNGPLVPCRIFLEQPIDDETGELIGDEVMRCEVDGKRRVAEDEWTWLASRPISQEEFLRLSASDFAFEGEARPNHLPF